MPVVPLEDEETKGLWLSAGHYPDQAEVGAYLPADLTPGSLISIFWRGNCTRDWLISALEQAEWLVRTYAQRGDRDVATTLFAFDPTKETVRGSAEGIFRMLAHGQPLAKHSAYRAEFHFGGSSGNTLEFSIWANVAEADRKNLEEAGENAGIALSPELCPRPGADLAPHWPISFVADCVSETRPTASNDISDLIVEISRRLVSDTPKPGNSSLSF